MQKNKTKRSVYPVMDEIVDVSPHYSTHTTQQHWILSRYKIYSCLARSTFRARFFAGTVQRTDVRLIFWVPSFFFFVGSVTMALLLPLSATRLSPAVTRSQRHRLLTAPTVCQRYLSSSSNKQKLLLLDYWPLLQYVIDIFLPAVTSPNLPLLLHPCCGSLPQRQL